MTTATEYASAASGTSWTSATNANADDAAYATYTIAAKNTTGNVNTLSSFGFDASIPVGATINSVQLEVEHKVSTTGGVAHLESAVAISGTPGTFNTDSTEPTTDTARTYSALARPGGGSWTRDDLLDGTFTVQLRARSGNNATSVVYSWDYARVTVDYTASTPYSADLTAPAFAMTPAALTRLNEYLAQATAASFVFTGQALSRLSEYSAALGERAFAFSAAAVNIPGAFIAELTAASFGFVSGAWQRLNDQVMSFSSASFWFFPLAFSRLNAFAVSLGAAVFSFTGRAITFLASSEAVRRASRLAMSALGRMMR